MHGKGFGLLLLLAVVLISAGLVSAQSTTAPISGSVVDPNGAVVSGASVTVKNINTGAEFKVTTSSSGAYTVPALGVGVYTVTIEAGGFKKAVVENVKIDAAVPATVNVALEVGEASESVVVQGGAEILQTQTANVSTTITGRQITELPFTSRDALDLVLLLPGTNTPGRPRTSTINGLPKGALNITMDGVNVQDNTLKSSDGFFTYIRPRIDAVDEVTVSTATPGAESGGEGAVQIKFVTRSGDNEYHGSIYEYHRNPVLNSNYYFNNLAGLPRSRVLLNQYGFRFGGPIALPRFGQGGKSWYSGKDRAFFFVNYEEYRLPEQQLRQRTILTRDAQAGIFKYLAGGTTRAVDLYSLAGADTPDPTIAGLLGEIRQSTTTTGFLEPLTDPNYERFTFINTGSQQRYFPTVRLDFNLTNKLHLENIYNYNKFGGTVDFLNGVDPRFPGFPNKGSQVSNRFSNVTALRWTVSNAIVNEARFGLTGGTVLFFPEVNVGQFANQGGYNVNIGAAGITSATATTTTSRRNSPVWQFNDTVNWTRGSHNMNFGFNFTQINYWGSSVSGGAVRGITLGIASGDPAEALFNTTNFPGATPTQLNQARALYATLTGRMTAVSGTFSLDEETGRYRLNDNFVQRARQREIGFFGQDSWRVTPNLTLNYGLRWEVQLPFQVQNNNFTSTTYAGLFGVSGEGNVFKPGTLTGSVPQYTLFKPGDRAYEVDKNAFAPSFGFAWSPNFNKGPGKWILGEGGRGVVRGGYSIAYNREGMNVVLSILGSNPGGTLNAARSVALANLTPGSLFRNGVPGAPTNLPSTPTYPITASLGNSINGFLPNLQTGYVQSWTFGIQREINRDTVVEVRYVGNRGTKLWRQYNINEINTVENGFFNEFKLAQNNLAICQANTADCLAAQQANGVASSGRTANSFANWGLPGQAALPIILAHFSGRPSSQAGSPANYTSAFFRNATFIQQLSQTFPNAVGFANTLYSNPGNFLANARAAGLPDNLFVVNPSVGTAGSWLVDNGGATRFDSLTFELRRRLSKGLLVQGNYAFSKGFTNMYASSSVVASGYTTLRDPGLNKAPSPFVVTHAFKGNWIYELPFGRGKAFGGGVNRALDQVIGGWEFHGTMRIQSGSPVNLGAVDLVGMSIKDLNNAIGIRKEPNRIVYWLPQDIIDNTRRAYGTLSGTPSGKYIRPVNLNNPIPHGGASGFSNVVIYGPWFTRFDLSAVKRFRITERVNFELRGEFLNAFNNTNFLIQSAAADVTFLGIGGNTFGQTANAYQDSSTTNDPGGRLIQIVARINF